MKETLLVCHLACGITSVHTLIFIRYVHVINLEISRMKCAGESDRHVRRNNGAKNGILSSLGLYHLLRPIHT